MLELLLGTTVLVIGDSHTVGPFGWYLDENLRSNGHKVATYGSCGSIAQWWSTGQQTTCGYYSKDLDGNVVKKDKFPTPNFKKILEDVKPDSVIVELGTNYVKTPSDAFVKKDLASFVNLIKESNANCFWISPPDMRKFRGEISRLDKLIDEAVGKDCKVFDSKTVTKYPLTGGDGIHYWFTEALPVAHRWADGAYEAFTKLPHEEI